MSEANHASRRGQRPANGKARTLHRIATVRRQEGMSLRGIARKLRVEIGRLRQQENETTDMLLTDLYRWQKALRVPIADLLVDRGNALSAPIFQRAQMVKLTKTVASILEHTDSMRVKRLARMLMGQLMEVMPELEGVAPWPTVGQRRTLEEPGVAAYRCSGFELPRGMEYIS